jgi:hypothetical protein
MISRIRITSVLVAGGLLLAGLSVQAQGVVGSQHDLTSTNSQGGTTATDQVCVFCHTPHGADTTAPAPLWNKVLGNGGARFSRYSTLNTPSFDSAEAPVGSVSLACLSCHDGTQAMDVVLNRPGSDGYDPNGTPIDGGIGVMTGTPVPMLGEDLSNDHPISMQYAGGGVNVTTHPTDGTFPGGRAGLGDPDFVPPERATINGQPIWWVNSAGGGSAAREKADMLLYTRDETSVTGGVQPYVECGSCHDPHNAGSQTASQVAFLRTTNAASAVCTACHIK